MDVRTRAARRLLVTGEEYPDRRPLKAFLDSDFVLVGASNTVSPGSGVAGRACLGPHSSLGARKRGCHRSDARALKTSQVNGVVAIDGLPELHRGKPRLIMRDKDGKERKA